MLKDYGDILPLLYALETRKQYCTKKSNIFNTRTWSHDLNVNKTLERLHFSKKDVYPQRVLKFHIININNKIILNSQKNME